MTSDEGKKKLPPEVNSNVVEISFRHVFLGFMTLVSGVVLTGTLIVLVKDWSRYRRQQALIIGIKEIIINLQQGGFKWKDKKEATSSATRN